MRNKAFLHRTVLLLLSPFLASGSQQSGLAVSPNSSSAPPRYISRDWDCLEIFEQNISVSEKKDFWSRSHIAMGEKRDFGGIFCRENAQYESLYLPEFLLCILRALLLSLKLYFPLGAGCIFCGILLCCLIPRSTLKMFVWFNKLILNDLIRRARLVLFGLIMLKMLFPEVFRFFSFLP